MQTDAEAGLARELYRIERTAHLVRRVGRLPGGERLLRTARRMPLLGPLYQARLAFHRPYPSLREAEAAVARYRSCGHDRVGNAGHHLRNAASLSPSDYPVLFHLSQRAAGIDVVFDLGGNVGNLYYAYAGRLALPARARWMVHDLPSNVATGQAIAREHDAGRLAFTTRWMDASGASALLASGSLHYFDRPLPEMLADLADKPRYVIINRTPLTDGEPLATVQSVQGFVVACFLYNRQALVSGLRALGYRLVDRWDVAERSLEIVGYPEHGVIGYGGMFLELEGDAARS